MKNSAILKPRICPLSSAIAIARFSLRPLLAGSRRKRWPFSATKKRWQMVSTHEMQTMLASRIRDEKHTLDKGMRLTFSRSVSVVWLMPFSSNSVLQSRITSSMIFL